MSYESGAIRDDVTLHVGGKVKKTEGLRIWGRERPNQRGNKTKERRIE
jgi:hypothetical protein